jgi:beta-lactamase regulating signal transducer with metallopeptidase domain
MSIPPALTGWMATYALHSTILLGLVLLINPRLGSDAWRETLWKTALLGGLLTATLQTAAGYTPLVGRWTFEPPVEASPPGRALARQTEQPDPPIADSREHSIQQNPSHQTGGAAASSATTSLSKGNLPDADKNAGTSWIMPLVAVWFAVAGLLLGRLALQHVWLFRVLANRKPVTEGPLPGMLAALRRHAGIWAPVRLTASAACPTPIALGRRELCVPERFLTDLQPDQQRSALAHELAHLRRGDPMWQLTAGIIESVFFFQPLNRVARRRLRDAAENLCDDWAVRHTGSALGLARCLTDIASWVSPTRIPEATLAIAEGGSPLLRRVERLAEWREPPMHATQFRSFASVGLLAFVALVAPAVSQSITTSRSSPARGAETTAAPLGSPLRARDSVIVHPNPSAPLAERWSWALARGPRSGFWIAWGVDGPQRVTFPGGSFPVSSNSPGSGTQTPGAPPLQRILAGSGAAAPPVAFLFGFGGEGRQAGEVRWIRLRASDAPLDLAGRPVLWLGPANAHESLAELRRLYSTLADPALRKEIAAALSLHDRPAEAVQAVVQVIEQDQSAEVRAEAIQWLPRAHPQSDAAVAVLLRTALKDHAKKVQIEAVDALAALGSETARHALVRIAETHPDWSVRSEAAQALASRERN